VKIIIKFILKNIIEKKLRTLLILFSIILSSALFFASQAITGNAVDMFVTNARQFYGSADIVVYPGSRSPHPYLKAADAEAFAGSTKFMIGALQSGAFYSPGKNKTVSVNLRGTTIGDLKAMNSFYVDTPADTGCFTGRKVIISKKAAAAHGLKTGDAIKLDINGKKVLFTICAVANPKGFFSESGGLLHMAVPRSTLSSLYGNNDCSNILFVKLKDGIDLKQSLASLKKIYKHYTVEEPIPAEDIKNSVGSMSTGFMMMTVAVAFMSIFILYTSFKVITLERLPIIGTFRSIGATRRATNLVLLAESLVYGIIGGILGCFLGLGILYLITLSITPSYMAGYEIRMIYSPAHMISAFAAAIALSLISSVIPIIKISKIPVKEIILNTTGEKNKSGSKRYAPGFFMLFLYIVLPMLPFKGLTIVFSTISMLSSVTGVILLLPLITEGFVKLSERIYIALFGNIGTIAAKNLRQNKSVLNNIALLSIAISTLLMITTTGNSVLTEISGFYTRNAAFEVYMVPSAAGRSLEQSLLTVDGVLRVCGNYKINGVEIAGTGNKIGCIYGINTGKFPEFFNLDVQGGSETLFESLNHERSMIISSLVQKKLGVDTGDYLTLKMPEGNASYKIAGIHNSMLDNGSNILIADRYFKADTGIRDYTEIYIMTDKDPGSVVENIKAKYARNLPYIITIAEMERNSYEVNSSVFLSMEAFAWLILIIGIFGIINNYLVSYIERKRSLAMYRSIGMSRRQIVKMMLAESLTGGLIGGITGIAAGLMMISTVPYVMQALNFRVPILLKPSTLVLSFLIGVTVTIAGSISPIFKSSRLNLIEALKYE